MNNEQFGLSIVIPTYFNSEGLVDLLNSINEKDILYPYEILVVSNLEDASLSQLEDRFLNCKLFEVGSVGVNFARNLGIRESVYPYLYFLDDDCRIDDIDFFKKLREKMQSLDSSYSFVGGYYDADRRDSKISWAYIDVQNQWLSRGRVNSRNGSAYLVGGNCGGPRKAFLDLKFDESIVYGGSETEFFLRAYAQGYKMHLEQDLNVIHYPRVTLRQLLRKAIRQSKGAFYISKKGYSFSPIYMDIVDTHRSEVETRLFAQIYHFVFRISLNMQKRRLIYTFLIVPAFKLLLGILRSWKMAFVKISYLIETLLQKRK